MKGRIQRTFVREEAYLKLLNWIVEGTLAPGAQLRDKELALKLGVSRTPIREALLRLEDEGLVNTKPNCSTLVAPIDYQSASYLYSLVWTLEQLALSEAFPLLTERHIEAMTRANERLLQSLKKHDGSGALDADNDFHAVYIELSQNTELQRILSELKQKRKRLDLYYFEQTEDPQLSYKEHEQLIQAIKRKDLPSALKALESNWKDGLSRLQKQQQK